MTETRPIAAVIAAIGSLGIGISAYIDWLASRAPLDVPIRRLWDDGVTAESSSYWRSLAIPLVVASVVGLLGVALRSRTVLGVAFLAGVVTLGWYLVRENDLRDGLDGTDMPGVWVLIGGLALTFVGAAALRHRVSTPTTGATSPDSRLTPPPVGA